jgi:putative ABC transport system substrate-binding protein
MNFGLAILDFGVRRGRIPNTIWIGSWSGPNRKSKIENRKLAGIVALAVTFAMCGTKAQAQPGKVSRIGYLSGGSLSVVRTEPFRQGLRDLGYVEGKNILIEWRSADGKRHRLSGLVAELVRLKVAVIVTTGSGDTRMVKEATSSIPIIMTQANDPVGSVFVASLARPGGNITGLSSFSPELSGKRLELLKEIVPKLSRIAVFGTSTSPGNAQALKDIEVAAGVLGVKLQYIDVLSPKDIETAFRAANKGHADAVLMNVSGSLTIQQTELAALAVKSRLPVIFEHPQYLEAGGLMSYGPDIPHLYRRAATYVDKILKGANPADLPVEQPTKFELVINLKAANQIGLTIPPNVLARADRVIK